MFRIIDGYCLIQFLDNNTRDVHRNWDTLKARINTIISTHVPSKRSSGKAHLPWLNITLRRAIRRNNRLYCKPRRSKNPNTLKRFREAKRSVQRALHHTEWDYINNSLWMVCIIMTPNPSVSISQNRRTLELHHYGRVHSSIVTAKSRPSSWMNSFSQS